MVSQFMKEHNARRIAASQFKEGGQVAIVNHHWDRRIVGKRLIAKVYATGNFILAPRNEGGPPETQQWRPDQDGTHARHAGKHEGFRHHEPHLEPWTPAIDAEIADRKASAARAARKEKIIAALQAGRDYNEETLTTLEQALGLTATE